MRRDSLASAVSYGSSFRFQGSESLRHPTASPSSLEPFLHTREKGGTSQSHQCAVQQTSSLPQQKMKTVQNNEVGISNSQIILYKMHKIRILNNYNFSNYFKIWNPYIYIVKCMYACIYRQRGREEERVGGNINVRKKYWSVVFHMHPNQGLNLQSRHVPWPGIEPATYHISGHCPTKWATVVMVKALYFL